METTHHIVGRRMVALAVLLLCGSGMIWASTKGPDAWGYKATDETVYSFVDISGSSGGSSLLAGTDDGIAALTLPFSVKLYGTLYPVACVSTNGALYLVPAADACAGIESDFANTDITATAVPSQARDLPAILPLWSDLSFQAPGAGSILYQTLGEAPNRRFIVQWNRAYPQGSANAVTFQVVLREGSGRLVFQYQSVDLGPANPASNGGQATVGIRNTGGVTNNQRLQWSYGAPVIHNHTALEFSNTLTPTLRATGGTFTYDGQPHPAVVTATGVDGGALGPVVVTYNGQAAAPVAAGAYAVVASLAATGEYESAVVETTVRISQATPTVTWNPPASIGSGIALSSTQLNASASVAGTFAYTPPSGTVLPAGLQSLSVIFTPTDAGNYTTATDTKTITVSAATPVVTWNPPASIGYGTPLSSAQLNATANVPGAFEYAPAAGTVLSIGTQTLTAIFTPADAATYATATATTTLTITQATPAVAWAAPASIVYGTALGGSQLNATASVPGTFAYTPASGTAPSAGTQTLSVTFTPTDTLNYANATATTAIVVSKATPVVTWSAPSSIVYGTALSATQLNATANVAGAFAYTPPSGAVPTVGTQTLTVTFTPTDTANYANATATTAIVVNKATPVVTWNAPSSITYGTALSGTQLNATANVAGTFAYTPASGTALSAGTQSLSVTFTPDDATNYVSATKTTTILVDKATPVVTWNAPSSIVYGTQLSPTQLNATTNVAGTFAYAPASGSVPSVGTQTLSVTFTPTASANYTTATATTTITVSKATPVVTWPTPANIAPETPLSAAQLNATANVPGTFVYSPPAGTVLGLGAGQPLSVTFSPSDSANYNTATATTTITVTRISSQTIGAITAPATAAYQSTFVVAATASSGLPVSFGVSGVCSIVGTTVTMTNWTGTCTITASQTGNASYSAATPVTKDVTATRIVVTGKDQCKDNGWTWLMRRDGTPFKNQGDCVSYTNTGK